MKIQLVKSTHTFLVGREAVEVQMIKATVTKVICRMVSRPNSGEQEYYTEELPSLAMAEQYATKFSQNPYK